MVNGVPEVVRPPDVLNGVPQTAEGPGKRAMYDAKWAKEERERLKRAAAAPGKETGREPR